VKFEEGFNQIEIARLWVWRPKLKILYHHFNFLSHGQSQKCCSDIRIGVDL